MALSLRFPLWTERQDAATVSAYPPAPVDTENLAGELDEVYHAFGTLGGARLMNPSIIWQLSGHVVWRLAQRRIQLSELVHALEFGHCTGRQARDGRWRHTYPSTSGLAFNGYQSFEWKWYNARRRDVITARVDFFGRAVLAPEVPWPRGVIPVVYNIATIMARPSWQPDQNTAYMNVEALAAIVMDRYRNTPSPEAPPPRRLPPTVPPPPTVGSMAPPLPADSDDESTRTPTPPPSPRVIYHV